MTRTYIPVPFFTPIIPDNDAGKEKFSLGRLAEWMWNVTGKRKPVSVIHVSDVSNRVTVESSKIPKRRQTFFLTLLKVVGLVLFFPFFFALKCIYRIQNKFLIQEIVIKRNEPFEDLHLPRVDHVPVEKDAKPVPPPVPSKKDPIVLNNDDDKKEEPKLKNPEIPEKKIETGNEEAKPKAEVPGKPKPEKEEEIKVTQPSTPKIENEVKKEEVKPQPEAKGKSPQEERKKDEGKATKPTTPKIENEVKKEEVKPQSEAKGKSPQQETKKDEGKATQPTTPKIENEVKKEEVKPQPEAKGKSPQEETKKDEGKATKPTTPKIENEVKKEEVKPQAEAKGKSPQQETKKDEGKATQPTTLKIENEVKKEEVKPQPEAKGKSPQQETKKDEGKATQPTTPKIENEVKKEEVKPQPEAKGKSPQVEAKKDEVKATQPTTPKIENEVKKEEIKPQINDQGKSAIEVIKDTQSTAPKTEKEVENKDHKTQPVIQDKPKQEVNEKETKNLEIPKAETLQGLNKPQGVVETKSEVKETKKLTVVAENANDLGTNVLGVTKPDEKKQISSTKTDKQQQPSTTLLEEPKQANTQNTISSQVKNTLSPQAKEAKSVRPPSPVLGKIKSKVDNYTAGLTADKLLKYSADLDEFVAFLKESKNKPKEEEAASDKAFECLKKLKIVTAHNHGKDFKSRKKEFILEKYEGFKKQPLDKKAKVISPLSKTPVKAATTPNQLKTKEGSPRTESPVGSKVVAPEPKNNPKEGSPRTESPTAKKEESKLILSPDPKNNSTIRKEETQENSAVVAETEGEKKNLEEKLRVLSKNSDSQNTIDLKDKILNISEGPNVKKDESNKGLLDQAQERFTTKTPEKKKKESFRIKPETLANLKELEELYRNGMTYWEIVSSVRKKEGYLASKEDKKLYRETLNYLANFIIDIRINEYNHGNFNDAVTIALECLSEISNCSTKDLSKLPEDRYKFFRRQFSNYIETLREKDENKIREKLSKKIGKVSLSSSPHQFKVDYSKSTTPTVDGIKIFDEPIKGSLYPCGVSSTTGIPGEEEKNDVSKEHFHLVDTFKITKNNLNLQIQLFAIFGGYSSYSGSKDETPCSKKVQEIFKETLEKELNAKKFNVKNIWNALKLLGSKVEEKIMVSPNSATSIAYAIVYKDPKSDQDVVWTSNLGHTRIFMDIGSQSEPKQLSTDAICLEEKKKEKGNKADKQFINSIKRREGIIYKSKDGVFRLAVKYPINSGQGGGYEEFAVSDSLRGVGFNGTGVRLPGFSKRAEITNFTTADFTKARLVMVTRNTAKEIGTKDAVNYIKGREAQEAAHMLIQYPLENGPKYDPKMDKKGGSNNNIAMVIDLK